MKGPIWKYPIRTSPGEFQLQLPARRQLLALQVQDGQPFLWMQVANPDNVEFVGFVVVPTGRIFDSLGWQYVDTCQTKEGTWHLFMEAAL